MGEDSCWFVHWLNALPSVSSLQHTVAHIPGQSTALAEISTSGGWSSNPGQGQKEEWRWWSRPIPWRNFVHVIHTHANIAHSTRMWKSELRRVPNHSLPHWSSRAAAGQDGVMLAELCGRLAQSPLMLCLVSSKPVSPSFSLALLCHSRFHHNKVFWQHPVEKSPVL